MMKKWYAVYTRGRHEKKVAREFEQRGIEHYLPLWHRKRKWSDRIKTVAFPLFPGYVFVRFTLEDYDAYLSILKTPGVVKLVAFQGRRPEPIPEEDIESIMRVCQSGLPYEPFPYLKEGQWVEIRRGVLKGVRGYIRRLDKNYRLVLTVDLIQQALSVVVPVEDVEPLW